MTEELPEEDINRAARDLVGPTEPAGRYDFLFQEDGVPDPLDQQMQSWPELTQQQREIFLPYVPAGNKEADMTSRYDYLVGKDDLPELSVEKARMTHTSNDLRLPTLASEGLAANEFEGYQIDPVIMELVNRSLGGGGTSLDKVRQVRTDAGLREVLARYFLHKISVNLRVMPDRVAKNVEKAGPTDSYPRKLSSREYASILAVSMLDGSFKGSGSDEIVLDEKTNIAIQGQHRYAADLLVHLA
jgi:hypothetical protein